MKEIQEYPECFTNDRTKLDEWLRPLRREGGQLDTLEESSEADAREMGTVTYRNDRGTVAYVRLSKFNVLPRGV